MEDKQFEQEHIDRVSAYLSECTLFLRRENDAFPLKQAGKIAAYGCGVRNTVKGGTGSGDVNSRYFITVEQALKDAGFEIISGDWLDKYDVIKKDARKKWIKDVRKEARKAHQMAILYGMGAVQPEPNYELPLDDSADAAVYVVSRICGEGSDRKFKGGDVLLSDTEIRDILWLNEHYEKFMVVLNMGGIVDISPINNVPNILLLSELGVETGKAVADIMLGKANPSGKLSATWVSKDTYHLEKEFNRQDTYYTDGIYVGYRYYDTFKVKPLYPFGYGKSYSSFDISNLALSNDKECIKVSANVKNTSSVAGKEVLQVYVSCPNGALKKAYQDLAGFTKTSLLEGGQAEDVEVSFKLSTIASYSIEKEAYLLEKGNYIVRAGNASDNTQVVGTIQIDEDIITKQVKNMFKDVQVDLIVPEDVPANEAQGTIIKLSAADFTKVEMAKREVEVCDTIKNLTDEEVAAWNVGYFNPKGGIASIIGAAALHVPGAAGETTGLVKDKIQDFLVFADGPAGLRLLTQYQEVKPGKLVGLDVNIVQDQMLDFLPWGISHIAKSFMAPPKPKKGIEIKTQYTTAIPIGTAIAQSFNIDFAKLCGDIVGREMEIYNVDVWLAPAFNIQRSILCGRNFEYYSEDPILSGIIASNITKGVQSHPGRGVCVKHFACNNQETNRFHSNSVVDERACREIYLRAFEYCINDAQPISLMSSYNLLNGVHTSESRELINDFLFEENNFQGYVMTDWVVHASENKHEKYRFPTAKVVAAGGHSVFMPGSRGDVNDIVKGLKAGVVTREQLNINVQRIFNNMPKK